jgi:hypothetical protein
MWRCAIPVLIERGDRVNQGGTPPVFYDIEASSLDGFPIEIGWAYADAVGSEIHSESCLIRPPAEWDVRGSWDSSAAALHRITIPDLERDGRPVFEIARRMNEVLHGRELFADSPFDEPWLNQTFEAAGIDPEFTLRRTDPGVLIERAAGDRAKYVAARRQALRVAAPAHRAEADARHWATLWAIVAGVSASSP